MNTGNTVTQSGKYNSPERYGVPHPEWRRGQLETVRWILDNRNDTGKPLIVEAPVGSGKSAIGVALAIAGKSRVLTHTNNLQLQYVNGYSVDAIFGMANYPCDLNPDFNADDCMFIDQMSACPVSGSCTYIAQRNIVKNARRQSMSYAYWLDSSWPRESFTDFLYCDEAHLLPGIVKEHAALLFTPESVEKMGVYMYPSGCPQNANLRRLTASKWLSTVVSDLAIQYNDLATIPRQNRTIRVNRKMRYLSTMIEKIKFISAMMEEYPDYFFIHWNDEQLIIKPLTAKWHFPNMFLSPDWTTVMTSATIGNPEVLAGELGFKRFEFRSVESNYGTSSKPVFLMKDAPKLNWRSGEKARDKHASIVAGVFRQFDPGWSGLIHVSSRAQANDLANRLSRKGLQDRVWVADQPGTEAKVVALQDRMMRKSNSIVIGYSLHQGFDGPGFNVNLVAKIPFPNLADPYGKAEQQYNPRLYSWNTAIKTEQACGRIRRGEPGHYEEPGKPIRKFVGIVDGAFDYIKEELSQSFLDSVVAI